MHRRLFALVTAGILAAPLAAAVPLAAEAAPSQTGLTARNVAVCPTPQNTLTARCHAIRHEVVDRNGKPVSPNSSTPHGYFPADLQGAYNLASASLNKGAGQTIAIVDAYDDPNAATDLAKYRSQFKLPALSTCVVSTNKVSSPSPSPIPCFVKVNQNGVAGSYPRANGGWAQEISLDLDMASAICPNCNILLVEASSASFTNLGASVNTAANLGAVAISNSYGSSGDLPDASYGAPYNHPGIAVTASTGDSGYGVGYPATSDYTVAVGGTTLSTATITATNSRGWSESAWSGAGSGCSTYQNQPALAEDLPPERVRHQAGDRRRVRRRRPEHRRGGLRLLQLRGGERLAAVRRHQRLLADRRLGLRAGEERERDLAGLPGGTSVRRHRCTLRRDRRQQRQLRRGGAVHPAPRLGRADRARHPEWAGRVRRRCDDDPDGGLHQQLHEPRLHLHGHQHRGHHHQLELGLR